MSTMSVSPRSESPVNVDDWIDENKKFFLPPVCNRMMHDGQLKVFFVGGPNVRKDYHINQGEEFFFMIRGDMCLKVVENKKHKDIIIREGEVFLLPAGIPHSPQRKAGTVGLVIERERLGHELDGLRYYVGDTQAILYERWFHCVDLGSQLKPIIEEFFQSKQHKTGQPGPGSILCPAPHSDDTTTKLMTPFNVYKWMAQKETEFEKEKFVKLFEGQFKSVVGFYGPGDHVFEFQEEVFLWQLEADQSSFLSYESQLGLQDGGKFLRNQCIVVPVHSRIRLVNEGPKARTLIVSMPAS